MIARVEASSRGADSRFVVTTLAGAPRRLHEHVYCARGRAENLIKAHKLHLASDRTARSKATADQFRLVLHTAAYWLPHTLRGLAWRPRPRSGATPSSIRSVSRSSRWPAGSPSWATRIKVALPSAYPYRDSLSLLAARAAKPPRAAGRRAPTEPVPADPQPRSSRP